jgi:hypothetical protein
VVKNRVPEKSQVDLAVSSGRQVMLVREWARRLVAQEQLPFVALLPLARSILDEVPPDSKLSQWLVLNGLLQAGPIEPATEAAEAAIFIEGLTAARVLAWALRDQTWSSGRLPQIVLAALFGDVGRLLASSTAAAGQRFRAKRTEWLDRNHPSIGAAILASVHRAPPALALLVGQHHERLDGRGFPGGLTARELHPDAPLLAAAFRFAAVCLAQGPRSDGEAGHVQAADRAARVLLCEAESGKWPVAFARLIAQHLVVAEVPVPSAGLAVGDISLDLAPTSDRGWRVDSGHGFQRTHADHNLRRATGCAEAGRS